MTFLHASLFGAAAACIAVPILIHLLMRRRRKPVEWGAMRFLIEALRRTRRRRLIEKWLLLATRCLLVALIAVALGRPLLGAGAAAVSAGRTVYLVVDNSIASAAVGADGRTALENHKAAARGVLEALSDADRVGLVLAGGPAEATVVPASTNRGAVRELVERAVSTDSAADMAGALAAVATPLGAPGGEGERLVVMLSDWRAGSADVQQGLGRLPAGVRIVASAPAEGAMVNIAVTRVSAARQVVLPRESTEAQTATVMLERSGGPDQARTVGVRVHLVASDGGLLGTGAGTARFGPGEKQASVTVALDLAPGAASGVGTGGAMLVAQVDADALSRDDSWRLPIETRETLRVGIVSEGSWRPSAGAESLRPGQWLGLALRPTEGGAVELTDVEPGSIDGPRLAGLDAAIVVAPDRVNEEGWKRLGAMTRAGGLVVVFPAADATVQGWTDAMTTGMGLSWMIARQPTEWQAEQQPRLVGSLPPGTPGEEDLLGMVRGELSDLTRSVSLSRALPIRGDAESGRALLTLDDGTAVVWAGRSRAAKQQNNRPPNEEKKEDTENVNRGLVVYVGVALDPRWTDLPAKPLMVPLVQEIVRQGIGRARPAQWSRAGAVVRTPAQTAELRPVAGGGVTLSVGESGQTREPVRLAGAWLATDARGGTRGLLTVNPDARGSRVEAQEKGTIAAWLGATVEGGAAKVSWLDPKDRAGAPAMSAALTAGQGGTPTGPALLAIAALVALVETAIARWSSHARGETTGGPAGGASRA